MHGLSKWDYHQVDKQSRYLWVWLSKLSERLCWLNCLFTDQIWHYHRNKLLYFLVNLVAGHQGCVSSITLWLLHPSTSAIWLEGKNLPPPPLLYFPKSFSSFFLILKAGCIRCIGCLCTSNDDVVQTKRS